MMGWNKLDTRYKAAIFTAGTVLGGAVILVAIAMIFNWHLHQESVETFMAQEESRHSELIVEHLGKHMDQCKIRLEMMKEEAGLERLAGQARLELALDARLQLGDDWQDEEIRQFVLYGEQIE